MYALFEEAGKLHSGRVLSEADTSAQIELESGKRVKVKAAAMLLKFEKPTPASLLSEAAALSQSIELELAYEFASDEEFGFADLAKDYFSSNASTIEQVAALLRLHEAPHYFRRGSGKGRFRKAPAEIVQQALQAEAAEHVKPTVDKVMEDAKTAKKKAKKLSALVDVIGDRSMPLKSYTWIHRDAIFTDAQLKTLTTWLEAAQEKLADEK